MTKKERKIAMPTSTWFGGVDPTPSACRKSDRTIMIRVNDVIRITIDGIKLSIVIKTRIWSDTPYSEPASFDVISVSAGASAPRTLWGEKQNINNKSAVNTPLNDRFAVIIVLNCISFLAHNKCAQLMRSLMQFKGQQYHQYKSMT